MEREIITIDRHKYVAVPVGELTSKPSSADYMKDRYWIVINKNVLFFRGYSPQCNGDIRVAETIRNAIFKDAEIRLIPDAYIPNDINLHGRNDC